MRTWSATARGMLALPLTIVLVACVQGTDVVARATDGGAGSAPSPNGEPGGTGGGANKGDPPVPPDPGACGPPPPTFSVLTKSGDIHVFDFGAKKEIGSSHPQCQSAAIGPMAIDRAGLAWIAASGILYVVEPTGTACKPAAKIPFSPTAMAFVWDPKDARETLYVVDNGVLAVLAPPSFEPTVVGKLGIVDVRGLSATADGWLLAFAGDPLITIALVQTSNGATKELSSTKSPDPFGGRFVGGVPTGVGFELLFGPNAYAYPFSGTGAVPTHDAVLFTSDPGVVSVAASPCATLGK